MPNARRLVALLVLVAMLAGSSRPAPGAPAATTFEAPSGQLQAGPLNATDTYAQVLPSGRILRPAGTSVVVGMNALGFALTPDGRYAIVSNDDERQGNTVSALDGQTTGGYSLAVVDTKSMTVVDRYKNPAEKFFVGIVALRDPADASKTLVLAAGGPSNTVYALDLDAAGHLTPDKVHAIAMPLPSDPRNANNGHAFPSTIVLAPSHARAYVVNNLAGSVIAIDTRTRQLTGTPVDVGFFPLGAAFSPYGLIVANEGMMSYGVLPAPVAEPAFELPPQDLQRSSSIAFVTIDRLGAASRVRAMLPLDRRPDGYRSVGGVHPVAIAVMKKKPFAFVAMSGIDRVATISLAGIRPKAVGGTELRLFDKGPYGTQPSALALAEDQNRLYVALAGIDAIAVLDVSDPVHPHRLGLIPTGWYPASILISGDGKELFVANAKGFGHDRNFQGSNPSLRDKRGRVLQVEGDSNAIWATFERIDLKGLDLTKSTRESLGYLRASRPSVTDPIVPQYAGSAPSPIKHVVLILEASKTFDSMLGDLTDAAGNPYGPGDPSLVAFDRTVTPNLHALANAYGLAGNFYADAEESDAGHQFVSAGIASLYSEKMLLAKDGRFPQAGMNEDPEDYPRAGYIFDSLSLNSKTFRDYGDNVRLSGYDEGAGVTDDPSAPARGLGGLYSLDVPAPAVLRGHIDLNYPGWNVRIRDMRRAQEFLKDFALLVQADSMPDFTHIWLPGDRGGAGPNIPPLPEQVADGDRALGQIVEYLTHTPQWGSTAIFIMPGDAQSTRDHVNEHRTYAIVVSPYAKRHYLGMRHLSTVSVIKTEEEILGLPALSLGDLLATDLSDFFTPVPDPGVFTHIDVPPQSAFRAGLGSSALED